MSEQQPLDFDPGRTLFLLELRLLSSRTCHRKSSRGKSYPEEYVRRSRVLEPSRNLKRCVVGTSLADGTGQGAEVRYYDPATRPESVFAADLGERVPWQPYGAWHLEAMDSHGGWIASAVDLARFAAAFDNPEACPILSKESIDLMYARPPGLAGHDDQGAPKDVYYSLGWSNRVVGENRRNHWHTGSLSGTATILIRRHDGRNFVALFNARVSPRATHLGRAIDGLLHKAANEVNTWPNVDEFKTYLDSNE